MKEREQNAPDMAEERERWLRERNQNAVLATAVEVDDVEGNHRWKLKILLFVVLLVIGTATALTILLTRDRNGPTDPPTMIPTDPPTMSRFFIMQGVIASSFEDDFPNSPLQESALNWLVNLDPASLPVDTNSTMLLERYTAAHFHFATQGDEWTDTNGWLSGNPVCAWSGLDCTDEGFLARMDLGTCLLSSFCL
jgi:hypothetical protein